MPSPAFSCRQQPIRLAHQWRKALGLVIVFTILCWPMPNAVQAAAGDLDPTFGVGGKVITDFPDSSDVANAMAIQTDGKIVVAGDTFSSFLPNDFVIARYNSDGSLDTSFGSGGRVVTDFFQGRDQAFAVVIQKDGKIVAAGSAVSSDSDLADFALARYNADGSLDTSFGSGGKVTTNFFLTDIAASAAIQVDGKIVLGGQTSGPTSPDFALARYNTNGSLDMTFGSGGKVTTDFGDKERGTALVIQRDAKIILAGIIDIGFAASAFAVSRYNGDGSLDAGFGSGGKVTTGTNHSANAAAIQPDGKIIVAGQTIGTISFSHDFLLVRYNVDGSLDSSFGSGGTVSTDVFGDADRVNALALQSDGKIIAAGRGYSGNLVERNDFALLRYNKDGSLDPSFGSGGAIRTDFGKGEAVTGVALQMDGKIVAAGYSVFFEFDTMSPGRDIVLARYDNLNFDICLQDDSNGNLLQFNSTTGDYQFTNCAGVTIGGRGTLTKRGGTIALQHFAGDRKIVAKVDSSSGRASAGIQISSLGANFNISDRNINNNTCRCD